MHAKSLSMFQNQVFNEQIVQLKEKVSVIKICFSIW